MTRILLVAHCPSPNTTRLKDAVVDGIENAEVDELETRVLAPLNAAADDVLWADGIVMGTTENFGYMAGRIKDFFERIYYPVLERTQGKPFALWIRAGQDGTGTINSIEKIVTGLRWNHIREPLLCRGEFREEWTEHCRELGMLMAAGLDADVF